MASENSTKDVVRGHCNMTTLLLQCIDAGWVAMVWWRRVRVRDDKTQRDQMRVAPDLGPLKWSRWMAGTRAWLAAGETRDGRPLGRSLARSLPSFLEPTRHAHPPSLLSCSHTQSRNLTLSLHSVLSFIPLSQTQPHHVRHPRRCSHPRLRRRWYVCFPGLAHLPLPSLPSRLPRSHAAEIAILYPSAGATWYMNDTVPLNWTLTQPETDPKEFRVLLSGGGMAGPQEIAQQGTSPSLPS